MTKLPCRYEYPDINRHYHLAQAMNRFAPRTWEEIGAAAATLSDADVAAFMRVVDRLNGAEPVRRPRAKAYIPDGRGYP